MQILNKNLLFCLFVLTACSTSKANNADDKLMYAVQHHHSTHAIKQCLTPKLSCAGAKKALQYAQAFGEYAAAELIEEWIYDYLCPKVDAEGDPKALCPSGKVKDENGNCICPPGSHTNAQGHCKIKR